MRDSKVALTGKRGTMAAPPVRAPPWIQTITGRPSPPTGAQILATR
jgi:hypothetical protein